MIKDIDCTTDRYKIIRMHFNENTRNRTIKKGLTLDEAQAHCRRDDTHETIEQVGDAAWFDGYEKE